MNRVVASTLMLGTFVCIARADEVTDWNRILFQAALVANSSALVMPRVAAITEGSVFDAINGIDRHYTPFHVQEAGPRGACQRAAAIQAAYASLIRLYPSQKSTFDQKRSESLANLRSHHHRDGFAVLKGIEWGQEVADAIWAWRSTDGFNAVVPPFEGGSAIGEWRPTPPLSLPGALPQIGSMETWAIESHSQFRPINGPPALGTAQYARDFNETKMMGRASNTARSDDQTLAAQFWATSTTSNFWNNVALSILGRHHQSLLQNAQLLALLNVAMADAGIACWDAKYYFDSWRPITAIHLADQDGNPATEPDANWMPLLVTPPFPEYPSGHSMVSTTGATVLAERFGNDVTFDVNSDVMTGVIRHFTSFSAAVKEIKEARIDGGIHFRTACDDAETLGAAVAHYVIDHSFQRLRDDGDDDGDDRQ
jgi:PAP2 superfamily